MICLYCKKEAEWCSNEKIYGRKYGKSYMCYYCKPCDAYVGCHNNTKHALGIMANKELRKLRMECHKLFDKWWQGKSSRRCCYDWLQWKMSLSPQQAHIGMFDKEKCLKLLEILKEEQLTNK
jgi:hypothetical protein